MPRWRSLPIPIFDCLQTIPALRALRNAVRRSPAGDLEARLQRSTRRARRQIVVLDRNGRRSAQLGEARTYGVRPSPCAAVFPIYQSVKAFQTGTSIKCGYRWLRARATKKPRFSKRIERIFFPYSALHPLSVSIPKADSSESGTTDVDRWGREISAVPIRLNPRPRDAAVRPGCGACLPARLRPAMTRSSVSPEASLEPGALDCRRRGLSFSCLDLTVPSTSVPRAGRRCGARAGGCRRRSRAGAPRPTVGTRRRRRTCHPPGASPG